MAIIETDAIPVAILRDAGAGESPSDVVGGTADVNPVFYAKTTLPQAIMHLETDSFLGPTVNPHNTSLTAGGSSGGEAALIAGRGSVLG